MLAQLSFPDLLALLVLGAFFGFLALGAIRLRRIKRRGLEGHAHRTLQLGSWRLTWPDWWPSPAPAAHGWSAGPLDHDGRLEIRCLAGDPARRRAEHVLRGWLEEHGARLDAWQMEEQPGRERTAWIVEGRAAWRRDERAYLWLACIPAGRGEEQLLLCYRSSVLYGLADGFWLAEVARNAEFHPEAADPPPSRS